MSADNPEVPKKQKTSREVYEEKTGELVSYGTNTQKVMSTGSDMVGSAFSILTAITSAANSVLERTWGKDPITEINDLKVENKVQEDLDYSIFLDLGLLSVTRKTGEKISSHYSKHKFEGPSLKNWVSRVHFFTSDESEDYKKEMLKPDEGNDSLSPAKKAKKTVKFMRESKEMAAVLWVLNLRKESLFDFTPEFSRYYQQAKYEGRRVAVDEADEFHYLLKGKGAVYDIIKEEEALRKLQLENRSARELRKEKIENKKASESIDREEVDFELRQQLYKAQREEELKSEQKTRQQNNAISSQKNLTAVKEELLNTSEGNNNDTKSAKPNGGR